VAALGLQAVLPCGEDIRSLAGQIGELLLARTRGLIAREFPAIKAIKQLIADIAPTDLTVLVTGETGVGKEVVSRTIHALSRRAGQPFIKVNCASIPENLLEAELFGFEKGAFTGAHTSKPGRFELANGGTIFLDEIGEMSPALQAKLLQVLEDRTFMRLGGRREIQVDVRVIAATNKDMQIALAEGQFREDLYYRLSEVLIEIPPLRERREDIPRLVEYFVERFCKDYDREPPKGLEQIVDAAMAYSWPGNVRELANFVKRFIITGKREFVGRDMGTKPTMPKRENIEASSASASVSSHELEDASGKPKTLKEIAKEAAMHAERQAILQTLDKTRWNKAEAARLLGVSYKTLLARMRECGLE